MLVLFTKHWPKRNNNLTSARQTLLLSLKVAEDQMQKTVVSLYGAGPKLTIYQLEVLFRYRKLKLLIA